MLKSVVYSVSNLFVLMLCIQVVSSQLPPDQVRAMSSVYDIFENDTGSAFAWQNVGKNSSPCSWKGVNCTSGNTSINHLSFSKFSISTSEFLPILSSITSLESIDVSVNKLTSIPDVFYSDCGRLSELKLLNFSMNELSGVLPTFKGFSKLESLDFSKNALSGEIELELDGLGSLKSLNLSWNQFRGNIPINLGKMNLLREIHLSGNNFRGEIPVEITKYRNLSVIDLSGNALSGSIPEELGELTMLELFVLSLNSLTGGIPASLSNITTLKRFAANQNQFNGGIPSGITSYVGTLDLSYNELTGEIPPDLLSGPNLQSLDLTRNQLQGPLPAKSSTKLFRLRLGSNSLNGTIPSELFENLGELMYLELDNNKLSGVIPLGLGGCKKLALLNLAHNSLTGKLPPILGSLSNLIVLSLEFNNFVGEIPPQISQLNRLAKLNLSRNSLNGVIPSSISNLKNLTNLDLQGNSLNGPIPESIGNLSSLIELQLGRNQLSGRIPDMPSKLQIALNLSSNLFDGHIPFTLSRLNSLEVLDLSNNKFSGKIPEFLTGLSSLTHLLLSNNELSGIVPRFWNHVVLDTRGNTNLVVPGQNPRHKESLSISSDFGIAFASGIPVGLLITLAIFILRKYSRIHCNLLTPSSIYRSSIDFTKAMEAVADTSNIILKTRFSTYYKAVMPSGTTYLVKEVRRSNMAFRLQSHEKLREKLEDLGSLCNPNVMIPVAYVMTFQSVYFLYHSAPKCTLSYILHRRKGDPLDWASRYSIAIGVCQGLAFLHECNSGPIVLLDLSSESILLKNMNEPQIGDVELRKLSKPIIAGSAGYLPPEYSETMRATATGNVYSFGVVLLELVTGKEAVSEGIQLTEWALMNSLHQHKWDDILDANVSRTSAAVRSQMLTVLEAALACVSVSPEMRPNMVCVLQMLNAPRRQL